MTSTVENALSEVLDFFKDQVPSADEVKDVASKGGSTSESSSTGVNNKSSKKGKLRVTALPDHVELDTVAALQALRPLKDLKVPHCLAERASVLGCSGSNLFDSSEAIRTLPLFCASTSHLSCVQRNCCNS